MKFNDYFKQSEIEDAMKRNAAINREEFLIWLAIQITRDWGAPCEEESEGCAVCQIWESFEKLQEKK
jgi:hypothetical protein